MKSLCWFRHLAFPNELGSRAQVDVYRVVTSNSVSFSFSSHVRKSAHHVDHQLTVFAYHKELKAVPPCIHPARPTLDSCRSQAFDASLRWLLIDTSTFHSFDRGLRTGALATSNRIESPVTTTATLASQEEPWRSEHAVGDRQNMFERKDAHLQALRILQRGCEEMSNKITGAE